MISKIKERTRTRMELFVISFLRPMVRHEVAEQLRKAQFKEQASKKTLVEHAIDSEAARNGTITARQREREMLARHNIQPESLTCSYCGETGHSWLTCPNKQKDMEA